ncbi:Ig-like domain repeat protein [Methanobrevibacter sp. TMH8]|uniref:Ig-like domain repeat protein n=2 Tax=Methanobrevibacter sp. TMH8 TaxID=2848611 RepID=UPI001CCA7CFE|nr:Ig-like domain repeat protein [Methanobrevibacter sp. TMH8]MBZ9570083.1 Ig-like domain repeat protein [Methanobrevibacter sp. TMH8]
MNIYFNPYKRGGEIIKQNKKITHTLIIVSIFLLAVISLQAGFAATTTTIDNTTAGGISGALGSSSPGDIIELDEGTYTGNNNTNMTINKNITIQGNGPTGKIILDAQGLSRIFIIDNNLDVIFINITFINGNSTNGGLYGHGGAIINMNQATKMTLIDCVFTNNTALGSGGAILNQGNISLTGCNFTFNNAGGLGGGLYNIYSANISLINCNFISNFATDAGGGLLIHSNTKYFEIINCSFISNSAISIGGAIFMANNNSGIISNCTFKNHSGNQAGAVFMSNNCNVQIIDSLFEDNNASACGGALRIDNNCSVNITNSTFRYNNAALDGGAISISSSNVIISDCDLTGNSAGRDGGAVSSSTSDTYLIDSSNVNINNSTIIDNTAGNNGGGVSSSTGENSTGNSNVNVNDSDIANNTAGNNGDSIATTAGDGSSGNSEVNVDGDSTITNSNPDRDDNGIYASTGEGSSGEAKNNIADGVIKRLSASSTIIAPNSTVGKPTTIRGVAKDQNGNPLANVKLTVTVDGKVYTVTTNSAGEWSLTYIPTKIANIQVTVALNQNNVYYAFSKTTSFRAIQTVTLTISAPTINQGKKTNIKVTLKDADGNILKGKKVSITIKGKTYTATTNNNGIAVFNIAGLKGGKHTLTAKFAGDNNYKSSTISKVQKVNPKTNLGIASIKKLSFKKRVSTYRVTIANTGSLKSKATTLALFHMRNGVKIKTKYIKIKSIAPGKKISIIVSYFPDKANHRYCIAHFQIDPKNKNKEIILANNKKSISLKH